MLAERHASALPRVEEDGRVDGAADAVLGADGPVLLEGRGAVDRGLLRAGALIELVGAVGRLDAAPGFAGAARVVVAVGVDDVVLDQRVAGPAVDGEVLLWPCQFQFPLTNCVPELMVARLTELPLFSGSQVPE